MKPLSSLFLPAIVLLLANASPAHGQITEDQRTFFENKIRPVLAQDCYECHSVALKKKGGLLLDSRAGWQAGGDSGEAIVPGKASASLLIQAIRHEDADLKMPKAGAKLDDKVIADFEAWINMGAPDPRDVPASKEEVAKATDWKSILQRRKAESWCFQLLRQPDLPPVKNAAWSRHPVDRFILAAVEKQGLSTASIADAAVFARRMSYVITGLPPKPEEMAAFIADYSQHADAAVERYADVLLKSPHYGERWARHWMDWVRYAETHGSEGDPAIPFAWRYRDYLIRALNGDVPYPQMVKENIAGDLLPKPRINRELGINESALGTGQYRFVLHGFTPTDALDEMVTFTDNQIDVISKTFLGLTVSCARCHNHKFDPISQTDFYSLFGILASCRPALIDVDVPEVKKKNCDALAALKPRIRDAVAAEWLKSLAGFPSRLEAKKPGDAERKAAAGGLQPLSAWIQLKDRRGDDFRKEWQRLKQVAMEQRSQRAAFFDGEAWLRWDASDAKRPAWYADGNEMEHSSAAGEFTLLPEGDAVIAGILPAGWYTDVLSTKHRGVLASPRFRAEGGKVWARVCGENEARFRYVVQNYPRTGLIYPKLDLNSAAPKWVQWDLDYWKGDMLRLEGSTNADMAVEGKNKERSWFGVTQVIYPKSKDAHPADEGSPLHALLSDKAPTPASALELSALYADTLKEIIAAWVSNRMSDDQAEFLSEMVKQKLLPNALAKLNSAAPLVAEYRRLEGEVPAPTRAPGVLEADAFDQALFQRGDHKQPADAVPRRFLDAIDPTPYHPADSGRLQLAESLVSPKNPLAARVIVNRVWHYVFGRGLVATTDNFGRLGEPPTHPELLDYLASRFTAEGGSLKSLLRLLVTSKTFQLDGRAPAGATERDPENKLLTHFSVRRLEAECIRDTMLTLSGSLDDHMYGESVGGGDPRRSVYVKEIRNKLDPFLSTFDAPMPSSTRGRRDSTNVPAQSLALLNDPNVLHWAEAWSARTLKDASLKTDEERIQRLYRDAFGRMASPQDTKNCLEYLKDTSADAGSSQDTLAKVEASLDDYRSRAGKLLQSAREKMATPAKNKESAAQREKLPEPFAEWSFDKGLEERRGRLPLELKGSARIEDGGLTLDGNGFAESSPLPTTLREKTLEAWVKLDDLAQTGGGVMTVQMNRGDVFDAIVFGEKNPRAWLAGSNFFKRTQDFAAPPETDADDRPVHVALVYAADGTITAYRDGQVYGTPYRSGGLVEYKPGVSQVLFGLRHGSSTGGNRMLHGRILRARLYDRALNEQQIAATAGWVGGFVSDRQVLSALPENEKRQIETWRGQIKSLEAQALDLRERVRKGGRRETSWASLAHALFNTKEFIYLR